MTRWCFVDYENVGSLEKLDLTIYRKVVIFQGAQQSTIKFRPGFYTKPLDIVLIQIDAVGRNNLDFHLSFHLGRFDCELDPSIAFDIISNDAGFAGLVRHIARSGRQCQQITVTRKVEGSDHIFGTLSNPCNRGWAGIPDLTAKTVISCWF